MTTATAKTTPEINYLIGWIRRSNRTASAARLLVQFFKVVRQTTTQNFHISGSDDKANQQQQICHSLPLYENHSCQASETALRLFRATWSACTIGKTLNLTESSILKWCFCCSSRCSFLKSNWFLNNIWFRADTVDRDNLLYPSLLFNWMIEVVMKYEIKSWENREKKLRTSRKTRIWVAFQSV